MAKRAKPSTSRTAKRRGTTRKAAKRAAPAKAPARKAAPRKQPAKKPVARKATARKATAKKATAKKATAKKVASKKAAAPKRATARRGAAPQRFTVSHLREEDFRPDGLRPYARYRDLGIAEATGGLARAHVIRMIPPVTDEVRQRHLHHVDLQLVYVLKGWMKNEFEGHGVQMMDAGSCWLQPPGIRHTVLDYSDDLEVLEIIVPADFETHPAD